VLELQPVLMYHSPIEAAVILLPLFELICENPASVAIFVESLDSTKAPASSGSPLLSLLSLASYILAHASSSPRAAAYGKLMLANLLVLSEDPNLMAVMCNHSVVGVRLCRQVGAFYFDLSTANDNLLSECQLSPLFKHHSHLFVRSSTVVFSGCVTTFTRSLMYRRICMFRYRSYFTLHI
jgi:hypothetical protein